MLLVTRMRGTPVFLQWAVHIKWMNAEDGLINHYTFTWNRSIHLPETGSIHAPEQKAEFVFS